MRQKIGPGFETVLSIEADRISLASEAFKIRGGPELGEYLEGIDIAEEGFEDWLREMRMAAPPVASAPEPSKTLRTGDRVIPTISVLPLQIVGDDHALVGMGDFIAQEIIRTVARSHMVNVISHLSSRSFGGAQISLPDIQAALNTDFIVSGYIRLFGERLVFSIDLTDGMSGQHVWNEQFSVPMSAVFEPNAELFREIASEIIRSILSQSLDLGMFKPLPDLASHQLLMSAITLMFSVTAGPFSVARDRLNELATRVKHHSIASAWSAQWHLLNIYQGWSDDPAHSLQSAKHDLNRGLDANPNCGICLAIDGNVKTVLEADFAAAKQAFERSRSVNGNSALACSLMCVLHTFLGEGEEAMSLADRSIYLSPRDPRKHFFDALHAGACLVAQDYGRAIEFANASLDKSPNHISAHRAKIVGLMRMGKLDEARSAGQSLIQLAPATTVSGYLNNHPARHTGVALDWADALREAGIPR